MTQAYIDSATLYTLIEDQATTYVVKFGQAGQDIQLAVHFDVHGNIRNVSDEEAEAVVDKVNKLNE